MMKQYEFEKYRATQQNFLDVLNVYGVAIIPSLFDEKECDAMNEGMWAMLEHLTTLWQTPIMKDNVASYKELKKLYPLHSMLIQHWGTGHAQYVWDVRQNKKIVDIYAQMWNVNAEDLLVSFDGISIHMPPEVTKIGWYAGNDWLHTDQSFTNNKFCCVQSWMTGYDVNEGDATLSFLETSHAFHRAFGKKFNITSKDDWYKLNEDEVNYFKKAGCEIKRVKCPKGSLVMWDSRTIHCGTEAMKGRQAQNFRNVVYTCYEPRANCEAKMLAKKQKAFEERRMTSHWPCKAKLFAKTPRTYGNPIYDVELLNAPKLTPLGLKLAGF